MTDTPTPASRRDVHFLAGWRRVVLWPIGFLLRVWSRTLRIETDEKSHALISAQGEPIVFTLWHNRLFVAGEVYRRVRGGKRLYALISASKDGAWLAAFFETLGMYTVRGSSSKLGREALHGLVAQVRAGHDAGITPDGPRGPCYELKGGSLLVARAANAPTILFGAKFSRAWRAGSWDGFYVPLPFSRVVYSVERLEAAELADGATAAARMQERLNAINPDTKPHPRAQRAKAGK